MSREPLYLVGYLPRSSVVHLLPVRGRYAHAPALCGVELRIRNGESLVFVLAPGPSRIATWLDREARGDVPGSRMLCSACVRAASS